MVDKYRKRDGCIFWGGNSFVGSEKDPKLFGEKSWGTIDLE